ERAEPPPEENYQKVKLFFATDRAIGNAARNVQHFTSDRSSDGVITFGTAEVSIPRDHRMGELERPSIWRLEFREDPEKHVVLLNITQSDRDGFFHSLSEQVQQSARKEALVFVHGYNVEFAEAARRTAQLAYDLSFDGAPILYSWPSRGTVRHYDADIESADWSADHLRAFLQDLSARTGATTIHLVAHSMGNRVLTQALRAMPALPQGERPLF